MMQVNAILLIYWCPLSGMADTVMEHVNSFVRHSRFKVFKINTEFGFPEGLQDLQFEIIVLHYSLFGGMPFPIDDHLLTYIEESKSSYKIAFFQDEYRYWPQRSDLDKSLKINCVYTLIDPVHFKDTYAKWTRVPKIIFNLPGYVSQDLVTLARKLGKPDNKRKIDIGYRARRLPFYMGRGAQEKHLIGEYFKERAGIVDLSVDIEVEEGKRIYGRKWYKFLSDCRGVLGVESGVSVFDVDDVVGREFNSLIAENPEIGFEEAHARLLWRYENQVPYRTISPRHFEAAAFRVCQILFEGKYSGIMQPMVHFIPLKKDFSNFEEVVRSFKDKELREDLTKNAYRDLIASGHYSYNKFIEDFDRELIGDGLRPEISAKEAKRALNLLRRGRNYRLLMATYRQMYHRTDLLLHRPFPGRKFMVFIARPALRMLKNATKQAS